MKRILWITGYGILFFLFFSTSCARTIHIIGDSGWVRANKGAIDRIYNETVLCVLGQIRTPHRTLSINVVQCKERNSVGQFMMKRQGQWVTGATRCNSILQTCTIWVCQDLAALRHELIHAIPVVFLYRRTPVEHGNALFLMCEAGDV